MKTVAFTVDVEPDVEPFARGTAHGIRNGLPPLFDLLEDLEVPADFFFLGSIVGENAWIPRKAATLGYGIGSHGWDHALLCAKSVDQQLRDIDLATAAIEKAGGTMPRMFRAANFSISGPALEHLSRGGYILDSSVIPGRHARRWRLFTIYDYRGALSKPYRPSLDDFRRPGSLPILEIPVTSNRDRPGTPLGTAYLNTFGVDRTLHHIRTVPEDIVILLIHPWELVDLGDLVPGLPEGYVRGCSSDLSPLRTLIEALRGEVRFAALSSIATELGRGGGFQRPS